MVMASCVRCVSGSSRRSFASRPLVHLSSAPGAKFEGCEIGSPYPIVPHETSSALRHVDSGIPKPWYADTSMSSDEQAEQDDVATCGSLLGADQIRTAREVGRITREVADHAVSLLREGVTTDVIDEVVHNGIISRGAYPSLLHYRGFHKSLALNINEVVALGLPDWRPIEAGDVITVVVACFMDGLHCKVCETTIAAGSEIQANEISGDSSDRLERSDRLIQAARDAVDEAIREASKTGATTGDVYAAIQSVANLHGCRVVKRLGGHGIGTEFQCAPYVTLSGSQSSDSPTRLEPGTMLSIEPILVEGHSACAHWSNGFTSCTVDGGMGAQFGATVLIADGGAEVLTSTRT